MMISVEFRLFASAVGKARPGQARPGQARQESATPILREQYSKYCMEWP